MKASCTTTPGMSETHTHTHIHTHIHTHAQNMRNLHTHTHTHTHTWLRFNGVDFELGNEYIRIDGTTNKRLRMKACLLSPVCCLLPAVCCLLATKKFEVTNMYTAHELI
jgi:hypothetical protein